jgi:hypothetical protein
MTRNEYPRSLLAMADQSGMLNPYALASAYGALLPWHARKRESA